MRTSISLILAVLGVIGCNEPEPVTSETATTQKATTREATTQKAAPQTAATQKAPPQTLIIDVRTPGEYEPDHVKGAINIPVDAIVTKIEDLGIDKDRKIVVYCLSGVRSAIAMEALMDMGYTQVTDGGGIAQFRARMNNP